MTSATIEAWETDYGSKPSAETIWGALCSPGTCGGRLIERRHLPRPQKEEAGLRLVDEWLSGGMLIRLLGGVPSTIALSRTFGGLSIGTVGPLADRLELKNRRRLFLINKKFHFLKGISPAEEKELRQLQADFESYLDVVRPLPNRILDELEALAEQLEAEDERP